MRNIDFFDLKEGQLLSAINSVRKNPQRLSVLRTEFVRMVMILDNLLVSFPNSTNDQRVELKLVVLKLQRMIEEIEILQLNNENNEEFRLTNSRYVL